MTSEVCRRDRRHVGDHCDSEGRARRRGLRCRDRHCRYTRRLSAVSYLECGIVLDSQRDPVVSRGLDDLIGEADFIIEPVTEHQAHLARRAYADFGNGSGHPAGLDFGDCISYALAIDRREPLLRKGNDFGHTGVQTALD